MPTIAKSDLMNSLVSRVSNALENADANADGAVSASERASTPDDVRGLADPVADYYFSGGDLPNGAYVSAYSDFVASALDAADANGDGELTAGEQSSLPASVFNSVVALRASQPQNPAPVTPPVTPPSPPPSSQPTGGASVLGISGTMGPQDVNVRTVLATGLNKPTDLAFNPHDGSLWVVNRGDDSSIKIEGAETSNPTHTKWRDDSDHFMNNPMGLAFSPVYNEFASIQDTNNDYNGGAPGNNFMGPTLWPADSTYNGGHASHLDMLHHSPFSVGVEAGREYAANREYFVFNGELGSVDRYFFGEPHVHGGHDHSDGLTVRYASGELAASPGLPGHMALDDNGDLYIADTGHGRIVKLDTTRPMNGNASRINGHHDETPLYRMNDSVEAVTGASAGLSKPVGLAIHDGHLLVSDHATGHIKAFTKDGELVGDLDTGLGPNSITGIAVRGGRLYVTDAASDRVLELSIN